MKYAIARHDGVFEYREDNYPLKDGAIVLSDEDYEKLCSHEFILQNGVVVENPNPPMTQATIGAQA